MSRLLHIPPPLRLAFSMSLPLDRPRLSRLGRWGLTLAAIGLAAVLATARWLEPDPRGFGTHQQLGLPPCGLLLQTGMPCPTCGMTTSFAWMVRGRIDRAWQANPAGCWIAPLCGVVAIWMLVGVICGRPVGSRTFAMPLTLIFVASAGLCLLAWSIRMGFGRALR